MTDWWARAATLGIVVPEPLPPAGRYHPVVVHGTLAFTSGVVALEGPPWHLLYAGAVGGELSLEEGQASARGAMLTSLGYLAGAVHDPGRVERFLRLTGYVRCAPDFDRAPAVLDGASNLLADLFGEELLPARTALPVQALPGGASVEIEAIIALRA
jgi:enamine deaminase RidA (YjgF/YER057c/UK114 family)